MRPHDHPCRRNPARYTAIRAVPRLRYGIGCRPDQGGAGLSGNRRNRLEGTFCGTSDLLRLTPPYSPRTCPDSHLANDPQNHQPGDGSARRTAHLRSGSRWAEPQETARGGICSMGAYHKRPTTHEGLRQQNPSHHETGRTGGNRSEYTIRDRQDRGTQTAIRTCVRFTLTGSSNTRGLPRSHRIQSLIPLSSALPWT